MKYISFLILYLFMNSTVVFAETKKEIAAVTEEFPNYLFHIYSIAKIGYDNSYSEEYRNSIPASDLSYLKEHKQLLAFGDGMTGPLAVAFLFLPGYISPSSQEEAEEYFRLLSQAVEKNDASDFISRYKAQLDKIKRMYPFDISQYLQSIKQHQDAVKEIGRIFTANYPDYDKNIWPAEKKKMDPVEKKLNEVLSERNYIAQWEEITGLEFLASRYDIVLCSSIHGGARANSLGYEKNVFDNWEDFDSMVSFISHETGTHIMIGMMYQVLGMNRFDYPAVYNAYESLAEFYNRKFITKMTFRQSEMHEKYIEIFDKIYSENPGIKPADLLIKGMERYSGKSQS